MIKKLILSTLLLCGLANAAPTSTLDAVLERGVLRVGFDAGYQPFEMTNKQGQYIGFDVDLAKMVAKEMGVKVEFVNTASGPARATSPSPSSGSTTTPICLATCSAWDSMPSRRGRGASSSTPIGSCCATPAA